MSALRLTHQQCWELLPWLVNGSLEATEARRVEGHLEGCAICREEERACRELAGLLHEGATHDPERGLARIDARLDDEPPAPRPPAPPRRPPPHRPLRQLLVATPRPVRAVLAAQMAALLVLAALAGWSGLGVASGSNPAGGEVTFRTLSDPPPAAAERVEATAAAARLRLVFAEDAALSDVRWLLIETGARLVDGPSPFGVYTVELTAGGERAASGERRRTATETLEALRRHPAVVFAEPAGGAEPASGRRDLDGGAGGDHR